MPPAKTTEKQVANEDVTKQNMRFYVKVQDTPQEARKEIPAGKLKGYTDINPMWRIKKLTETFGPSGFGWWTQNVQYKFVDSPKTEEIAVFCELELVVVDPETKVPSQPIYGIGGNMFVSQTSRGAQSNDEVMKSAYTDALSIACKSLGFSHDIYYQKDRTKYTIDAEMAAGENSAENLKNLIERVRKGLGVVTKEMDQDTKQKFAHDVVEKHLGDVNYVACKDPVKLKALLDELILMAKK